MTSGEHINPAIKEELRTKFGIVFPEFTPRPKDSRQYTLSDYFSQEGYVRLEEAVNVFGERTRKPEGFVEYVVLGGEERIVVRREGHFERWGGSDDLRYADVEFIQGDTLTAYETPPYQFEYDGGQRYGEG